LRDIQHPELLQLASEHLVHARHLESYLLSFTEVFLVITGALWGYALLRVNPLQSIPMSGTSEFRNGIALDTSAGLRLVASIFYFHLFYCFLGMLFVIRSAVNFRKHWEMAHKALQDEGLDHYLVRLFPERAQRKGEAARFVGSFRVFLGMLLTVKSFFLLLYAGAASADNYFALTILTRGKIIESRVPPAVLSICLFLLLLLLALLIHTFLSKQTAREAN
jgi:hypothetical protein